MKFTIISIIVISIIGTLSHFTYELSNHNRIVGLFAAVNESVWEHIKIALTPTILWSLVDGIIYGNNSNYFPAKFISLLVIIFLIPILFYGYESITKKESLIIDIMIFYIVIITSQVTFNYFINLPKISYIYSYLACIGLFIIFGGYMIHTLMPANNILFKDPISNKYGFKGHTHEKEK